MKIAFWSNTYERCGVTSNLAAISVASVMRFPYTIITMENGLCINNLGRIFFGTPKTGILRGAGTNYYDGGGMEGLIRRISGGDRKKNILPFYRRDIIPKHLYYIPQSRVISSEIFDYEFDHSMESLFRVVEEQVDFIFIDTACRNNLSTKTILEEADLIVVNLCQNPVYLEDFFLNYSSLIPKALFLIGNYTSHSGISGRIISNVYNIPIANITAIPHNEFYHNALMTGNVVEFISSNYLCGKDHPNYGFIQAVKRAAYLIIKKAEQFNLSAGRELSACGR